MPALRQNLQAPKLSALPDRTESELLMSVSYGEQLLGDMEHYLQDADSMFGCATTLFGELPADYRAHGIKILLNQLAEWRKQV